LSFSVYIFCALTG